MKINQDIKINVNIWEQTGSISFREYPNKRLAIIFIDK